MKLEGIALLLALSSINTVQARLKHKHNHHRIRSPFHRYKKPAAEASEEAGEEQQHYRVECDSTKGKFALEIYREWSPIGVDRFMELVRDDFFTDQPLYRAVDDFLIQFGISGDPKKQAKWQKKGRIKDDPPPNGKKIPFQRGFVSYAGGGPNTRDTSVFIGISHNQGQLDWWGREPWETPLGKVVEGMDVVDSWYTGYGDFIPPGRGPSQGRVFSEGSTYTRKNFPKLDYMTSCKEVPVGGGGGGGGGGGAGVGTERGLRAISGGGTAGGGELLSAGASVTTDTRGNLGPPGVMTQKVPGETENELVTLYCVAIAMCVSAPPALFSPLPLTHTKSARLIHSE